MFRVISNIGVLLAFPAIGLPAPASEPAPPIDAAAVNQVQTVPISMEAKGPAVVRAQILLARAHFSCGQIDGDFGTNLEKTVSAFQRTHNLPVDGTVNSDTWAALNADTAPAIVTYTIDPQVVAGPFEMTPSSMMAQAKLKQLGYASPLDELSEKFHASPGVMQALNPGTDFGQAGQQIQVPNAFSIQPGEAASVVVSKSDASVTAYDAQGVVLAYYVATIGSEHDPLPIGDWKIMGVARNPVFHYNPKLFWDAKADDSKAVIPAGPRNPVGLVWIDLSKEHYGIHGTAASRRRVCSEMGIARR